MILAVPLSSFEAVTDLQQDDFFRSRIIYCIDLTEPTDDRLNVPQFQPRINPNETIKLVSGTSGTPQANAVDELNNYSPEISNVQNPNVNKFNLEDELKLINCQFYLDQLVHAGFDQEVCVCLYLYSTNIT